MQGAMPIFKSIECYAISFNITKSSFINNLVKKSRCMETHQLLVSESKELIVDLRW